MQAVITDKGEKKNGGARGYAADGNDAYRCAGRRFY